MTDRDSVKWGVMGTARIATKVGRAITLGENSQLQAIASRSRDKAEKWGAEQGAAHIVDSYEALLDSDIDAVYIPLPPSMHAEWTIKAAEKGKHVLCEKPFAMNLTEAEEMAAACRQHGVQLMDGVMWKHHPRTAAMRKHLDANEFGPLRRITSSFSFCWDPIPAEDLRFQRSLGGGVLGDLGWYCVGATLWAFGGLPERVFATARYFQDCDVNISAMLWFPGEKIASFDCGFDMARRKWFEVAGTSGSLVCDDFVMPWDLAKVRYWTHDDEGKATEYRCESLVQEVCMVEGFSRNVLEGKLDETWPKVALDVQKVCDALDRSARTASVVNMA